MSGTTRSSAGLDERRRRILFRAWHRGTRELDLLIGRFADAMLGTLNEGEVDQLEHLMDAQDHDIYGWITGSREVPPDYDTAVLKGLRDFHRDHPGADA
ncbi:succinate dehydrogenase assembly factor 2 [Blastochloris viridis]|uniref:FAD assembly factor SdhE n=1 Tax=Blastochloris viridis TaxID=1079 RepID=A0A0H5BQF0_BLAVI|nr:succinate dehydrogenase assembly factor 2 [Blastochloris viridis]ALK09292.1 Flavinator of succinate dehydrogenase [Blastochloris viridis]BAS00834.1 YgfY protein [Blastochloris viridis]CUU41955.1 Flavinator of succinate dehydrogenase [Blastochloris viridis]